MILIFEGCDCVGKTSLINEVRKTFGKNTTIKKFSNPPNSNKQMEYARMEYFNEIYLMDLYKEEINFIYDRFYFGEVVYAPIYRKYKIDYQDFIEMKLNELNAILVYVYCDEDIIKKRFDGKFIKEDDIKTILKSYDEELKKSKLKNIIYINTSKKSPEECCKKLLREIWT